MAEPNSSTGYGPTNFLIGNQVQSERSATICERAILRMNELSRARNNLNSQCEEIAALLDPPARGSFYLGAEPIPYNKNTDQQIDSTGMLAVERFMAICDSLLTPKNMTWHVLRADNDYVMKDRATQVWFYNQTRKLFRARYAATAGFVANNQSVFKSLGLYGNGPMFIDSYIDPVHKIKGLRYAFQHYGNIYIERDFQGVAVGFIRILRLTAHQAFLIPGWKDKLPEIILNALKVDSERKFQFLHRVVRRDDYDPTRLDSLNMPYASYYICKDSKTLMSEGGYTSLPLTASRYVTAPNEDEGRSIAMYVLPALKTLNAEKKVFLKAGHRAADPVLLLPDEGLVNMNLKPGAQNPGGMTADGKRLVDILPAGDIQITKEMMAQEIDLIEDAFLIKLFSIATELKSGTTATEVIERINEKGILIAPTLGRQESEYLGPMVDRELDLLSSMGMLDPMPPRLREARGEYKTVFTSPLAQSVRAGEAAGFYRSVEGVKELVNITGDQSLLDPFDFDVAVPDIAINIQQTPPTWMASAEKIAAKRAARTQQAQVDQQIKAAPAAAAMMKAQAVASKNQPAGVTPAARDIAPTRFTPGLPGGVG